MNNSEINKFSASLFWDVDRGTLDLSAHKKFIVQRVLERGTLDDWRLLKQCYTVDGVVSIAQQLRALEPMALAFIACVGNIAKETFRCYTWKQSHPTHWRCLS